ncbi:hypothetical protein EXIGLDRAFT_622690 [Exidia glandulosa HHB12029]|uniref:Uncharacterized protein n=1 Tax=Exidia glandulosa HHB12029 TaxID=1314781 RepID=A0A165DZE6_EXIGL|nr:hypothetical protein EXIGLDRAFT_622690 [Exidia glandulosa HHB12029]
MDKVHKPSEDTVHYAYETSLGALESNSTLPSGGGIIHLGPNQRAFSISMFHQLRCLNIMGRDVSIRASTAAPRESTALEQHCMNYLRQMILCRSSIRLESGINIEGGRLVTSSVTHTCSDWSAVYSAAEANYAAYKRNRGETDVDKQSL